VIIDGQRIKRLWSLKSWNDNNKIAGVLDTGETIRIDVSVITKMLNEFVFDGELARIHTHLWNPITKEEHYTPSHDDKTRYEEGNK